MRRYWEGRATDAERMQVEKWLQAGDPLPSAGESLFPDRKKRQKIQKRLWSSLDEKITPDGSVPRKPVAMKYIRYSSVLAASVVLLLIAYVLFRPANSGSVAEKSETEEQVFETLAGRRERISLPDGSTVTLNGSTGLAYRGSFSDTLREVYLKSGEAFFHIAKDAKRPFIVHTSENTYVKVLGTRFNVRNLNDRSGLEVALTEGQILFESGSGPLVMRPGQQIRYNAVDGSISITEMADTTAATGWMTNILRFNDTPLPEVFTQLERMYGVEFTGETGGMDRIPLTATFRQEPLSRILDLMEQSTDLKFLIKDKQVMIVNKKQ